MIKLIRNFLALSLAIIYGIVLTITIILIGLVCFGSLAGITLLGKLFLLLITPFWVIAAYFAGKHLQDFD